MEISKQIEIYIFCLFFMYFLKAGKNYNKAMKRNKIINLNSLDEETKVFIVQDVAKWKIQKYKKNNYLFCIFMLVGMLLAIAGFIIYILRFSGLV